MPNQPYVAAPPHCTLVHGRFVCVDKWVGLLTRALEVVAPFEVTTKAWHQFPDDPMTHGGHTVAYRAELDSTLASLQETVAKVVAPYAAHRCQKHPLDGVEPFATSLRKYGSAFVGPHWIPHFTIGSPHVAKDSQLLADLTYGSPSHRFLVKRVSIWHADGDDHRKLCSLALGNRYCTS